MFTYDKLCMKKDSFASREINVQYSLTKQTELLLIEPWEHGDSITHSVCKLPTIKGTSEQIKFGIHQTLINAGSLIQSALNLGLNVCKYRMKINIIFGDQLKLGNWQNLNLAKASLNKEWYFITHTQSSLMHSALTGHVYFKLVSLPDQLKP